VGEESTEEKEERKEKGNQTPLRLLIDGKLGRSETFGIQWREKGDGKRKREIREREKRRGKKKDGQHLLILHYFQYFNKSLVG